MKVFKKKWICLSQCKTEIIDDVKMNTFINDGQREVFTPALLGPVNEMARKKKSGYLLYRSYTENI